MLAWSLRKRSRLVKRPTRPDRDTAASSSQAASRSSSTTPVSEAISLSLAFRQQPFSPQRRNDCPSICWALLADLNRLARKNGEFLPRVIYPNHIRVNWCCTTQNGSQRGCVRCEGQGDGAAEADADTTVDDEGGESTPEQSRPGSTVTALKATA